VAERLRGYRQALADAGLPEHIVWPDHLNETGGAEAAAQLPSAGARKRPDAILALSDLLAVGVRSALHRAGVRVPEDVALAGYDDLPFAQYMTPPLTTVRLPYEEMGRAAVAWLLDAVRGRATSPLQHVYDPKLVIREST